MIDRFVAAAFAPVATIFADVAAGMIDAFIAPAFAPVGAVFDAVVTRMGAMAMGLSRQSGEREAEAGKSRKKHFHDDPSFSCGVRRG